MTRVIDLASGFTAASAPSTDGVLPTVTGSTGTPSAIVAGTGVVVSDVSHEVIFVEGSGGAVDISASPQIAAGSTVGQMLTLIGASDTNTVLIEDGDGTALNGDIVLTNNDVIDLIWNGTVWQEDGRS